MISAASKCGAAMSARCIMSTAPTAKFGATMPPTPLALHAVSSLSTSVALSPVVPTIGEAPAATAASALCSASEGRVKSTSARGRFSCKNSARSSPRPIPPTYSISGSPCSPMASTDPTLPRCPATATRIVTCPLSVAAWAPVSASTVAAATIPSTESTLSRRRRRRERGRHHLGVDAFVDRLTSGRQLLDRRLAAQVEPALAVDLDRLDHYLVADVADLFHPLDAVVGELGDVDQAILSRQDLDEGAERHDAHDLALVDLADLDLVGEAFDLDVHLQRGNAIARAGDLEVHVAQRVLDALDVGQHRELAFARDQAHRDAGDRGLDGHTRVHQGEGRAADRGHRRRAVGAEAIGDD